MLKTDCTNFQLGLISKKIILSFSLIFITLFAIQSVEAQVEVPTDAAVIASGEKFFKANCTVCHAINNRVIGPALRDITKRRDVEWILKFVNNSQKVIKSGDEYAVKLYNEYNKTEMTAFDWATDAEILSVVAYIKDESSREVAVAVAENTGGGATQVSQGPSEYVTIIMVGLVVVLVLILIVLGLVITVLKKYLSDKEDISEEDQEILDQKVDLGKFFKSNAFRGIFAFVLTVVVMKAGIDGLFTVGVQQGYEPTQPIAFSHKIHAGDNQIDCNYCHTGVRKSKSANIPSANICMNCHSAIKTESKEIQKIYAAIEKDEPIEWKRIHNLPDLAYFNHSQHVEVGKLECKTCHGPIEEMEVVSQYAPLTMGWCINCHRETDVNTKGNEYYTELVEMHNSKNKEAMKVEDMGGLECAKCHY
ncbi:MAG: mono/diheme cytochrome c family protein [Saprospiraceae bacterium]|jgi:mono/diheme cytochrome c family protein